MKPSLAHHGWRAVIGALSLALAACPSTSKPGVVEPESKPVPVETRTVKFVKVYTGADGLKVTLVRFAAPNDNEALVQISGTDAEIDNMVLEHKFETGPERYETVVHGRPYWTFRQRSRSEVWEVWFSGKAHEVTYDEAASTADAGAALIALHQEQLASGTLEALQRFNREERVADHDKELAGDFERAAKECGFAVQPSIDWNTVPDEMLGEISISGYCESPASALRTLCKRDSSYRDTLAARVKSMRCSFGADESGLELTDAGVLEWRVNREGVNLDELARGQLLHAITDNPLVLRAEGGHLLIADPLALAEGRPRDAKLYFGDATTVREQRPPPGRHDFYGGRMWAPRVDHETAVELKDGKWTLKCGDRSAALTPVTGDERDKLLASVKREGPLWTRSPFLLARDTRGRYYYVDHLVEGGKGYRVFRGSKGALKLTKLTNIVEDAQGKIFATKDGRLRLIVDKSGQQTAWWMGGKRKTDLTTVPVGQSNKFIYSELGVYEGELLGTPCDQY